MYARVVVLGLLAACHPGPPLVVDDHGPPAAEPTTPALGPDLAAKIRTLQLHMHMRFSAAQRLERAIAFGDLERAQGEAKIIAELQEPEVLLRWQPYLQHVRSAARVVADAETLVEAANGSASLGARCAACHVRAAARIEFAPAPPPTATTGLEADMVSHQWATARLWEGLIAPSPDRWRQGATSLVEAPLTIVAEADLPPERGVADDVARLRLLARRALDAPTQDARAGLYGEMLATCVGCHVTIRDR